MARRRYDDEDDYDYDDRPPRRAERGIGSAIALGVLGGVVGGEAAILISSLVFLKPEAGPVANFLAAGACCVGFALSPFFALLGTVGAVIAVRTRSIILGALAGAALGPLVLAGLWAAGGIEITVNNQPVKFTSEMFWWLSARLWVPGALGAVLAGLLVPKAPGSASAPARARPRFDDDDEDDRPRRRRRDDGEDDEDDRPRRRR